jgi:hypothetical protein
MSLTHKTADPGGCAAEGVRLQLLHCADGGFELAEGMDVFVVCCVGSSLCDELITR